MTVKKGVVLAAGMGTRLANDFPEPKPLIKVGGRPIICRTIEALLSCNIHDIGIVIGYRGSEVKETVEHYRFDENPCLHWIENHRWQEPNGLSVLAVRDYVGSDEFILCMSDHLFDSQIIRDLLALESRPGVTLAIDGTDVFDLEDATKVLMDDNQYIININKNLTHYNAIDCGLFRCGKEVFIALEKAFSSGGYSISDGMQVLARQRAMRGMSVENSYWQDIDTPEMLQVAERMLFTWSAIEKST